MKAFDNFKSNQKSVWNNIFLYVKVLVSFKFIQDTLHWDKTQMLKNSDKINIPKNALILKKKKWALTHHSFMWPEAQGSSL